MLSEYDLYDLYGIIVSIRLAPDDSVNRDVVAGVIDVLNNVGPIGEANIFRKALMHVNGLQDREQYKFIFTLNEYCCYAKALLKDERIYSVLINSFKELLAAIDERNTERVYDLADVLHDLPVLITENRNSIPAGFWKNEIKFYRKKWRTDFLTDDEKCFKRTPVAIYRKLICRTVKNGQKGE